MIKHEVRLVKIIRILVLIIRKILIYLTYQKYLFYLELISVVLHRYIVVKEYFSIVCADLNIFFIYGFTYVKIMCTYFFNYIFRWKKLVD